MITMAIMIGKKGIAYLLFIIAKYTNIPIKTVQIMPAEMIRPLNFILFLFNSS